MFCDVTPCSLGRNQPSFRRDWTAAEENVWTKEARDNCITRSFIVSTPYKILLSD
jgi:hypothetical protein